MTDPTSPFLTVEEVAVLLRVPRSWVYEQTRLVGNDAIPRYRAGKRLVFLRDEVLAWFTDTRRVGPDLGTRPRRRRPSELRFRRVRNTGQRDVTTG